MSRVYWFFKVSCVHNLGNVSAKFNVSNSIEEHRYTVYHQQFMFVYLTFITLILSPFSITKMANSNDHDTIGLFENKRNKDDHPVGNMR